MSRVGVLLKLTHVVTAAFCVQSQFSVSKTERKCWKAEPTCAFNKHEDRELVNRSKRKTEWKIFHASHLFKDFTPPQKNYIYIQNATVGDLIWIIKTFFLRTITHAMCVKFVLIQHLNKTNRKEINQRNVSDIIIFTHQSWFFLSNFFIDFK